METRTLGRFDDVDEVHFHRIAVEGCAWRSGKSRKAIWDRSSFSLCSFSLHRVMLIHMIVAPSRRSGIAEFPEEN